jgi:hypothetical protein
MVPALGRHQRRASRRTGQCHKRDAVVRCPNLSHVAHATQQLKTDAMFAPRPHLHSFISWQLLPLPFPAQAATPVAGAPMEAAGTRFAPPVQPVACPAGHCVSAELTCATKPVMAILILALSGRLTRSQLVYMLQ